MELVHPIWIYIFWIFKIIFNYFNFKLNKLFALDPSSSFSDGPSPLEHYLLGTTLLGRLCPLFELAAAEAQRTQLGKFKMPIREYNVNSDGVLSIALQR